MTYNSVFCLPASYDSCVLAVITLNKPVGWASPIKKDCDDHQPSENRKGDVGDCSTMSDMAQSARKNVTPQSGGTRKDLELSPSFLRRQESRSAGDGVVTHIRACAGMTEEGSVLWLLASVL